MVTSAPKPGKPGRQISLAGVEAAWRPRDHAPWKTDGTVPYIRPSSPKLAYLP